MGTEILKLILNLSLSLRPLLIVALVAALPAACAALAGTPTATSPPAPMVDSPTAFPTGPSAGRVRPAAVAGSWYPGDPDQLSGLVDDMLASAEPVDGAPIGLLVPHAGYAYSGPVAATGFAQLENGEYEIAVIIASDHRAPLSAPISVWAEGGFETPLGVVPVDEDVAQALIEADSLIAFDPAAHEGEHPIEIELPFLQRVCPDCRIVPVLMGDDGERTVKALADALLSVLRGRKAVVIASSDLSHYPSYQDARAVDGATLSAIKAGDVARVRATIADLMAQDISNLATCACGQGAILATMKVAQGLGADTVTILGYANSGDSPQGDRERVVGYGAVMFWRYEPPDLTDAQRGELLSLARGAIASHLEHDAALDDEVDDPALRRRSGVFVTLEKEGQLRGCVGRTRADLPLHRAVQRTAVSAATEDPRFPPLRADDLRDVTIEISILSPFRAVTDVEQIEVGTHGLIIFKDGRQGLLLPHVPVEQGWDRGTYVDHLCHKASLPADCWQEGATLFSFTAVVFGEE